MVGIVGEELGWWGLLGDGDCWGGADCWGGGDCWGGVEVVGID